MGHRSPLSSVLAFLIVLGLASFGLPSVVRATPPGAVGQTTNRTSGCIPYYVVRAGDTLSAIAGRCGVSIVQLAQANGLRLDAVIYPGQRLVMPAGVVSAVPVSAVSSLGNAGCPLYYTVRTGDTLAKIARRCGVSMASLMRWNGLRSDLIRVGQVLITGATSAPAPPVVAVTPSPSGGAPGWRAPSSSAVELPPVYVPGALSDERPIALPTPTPAIESPVSAW